MATHYLAVVSYLGKQVMRCGASRSGLVLRLSFFSFGMTLSGLGVRIIRPAGRSIIALGLPPERRGAWCLFAAPARRPGQPDPGVISLCAHGEFTFYLKVIADGSLHPAIVSLNP